MSDEIEYIQYVEEESYTSETFYDESCLNIPPEIVEIIIAYLDSVSLLHFAMSSIPHYHQVFSVKQRKDVINSFCSFTVSEVLYSFMLNSAEMKSINDIETIYTQRHKGNKLITGMTMKNINELMTLSVALGRLDYYDWLNNLQTGSKVIHSVSNSFVEDSYNLRNKLKNQGVVIPSNPFLPLDIESNINSFAHGSGIFIIFPELLLIHRSGNIELISKVWNEIGNNIIQYISHNVNYLVDSLTEIIRSKNEDAMNIVIENCSKLKINVSIEKPDGIFSKVLITAIEDGRESVFFTIFNFLQSLIHNTSYVIEADVIIHALFHNKIVFAESIFYSRQYEYKHTPATFNIISRLPKLESFPSEKLVMNDATIKYIIGKSRIVNNIYLRNYIRAVHIRNGSQDRLYSFGFQTFKNECERYGVVISAWIHVQLYIALMNNDMSVMKDMSGTHSLINSKLAHNYGYKLIELTGMKGSIDYLKLLFGRHDEIVYFMNPSHRLFKGIIKGGKLEFIDHILDFFGCRTMIEYQEKISGRCIQGYLYDNVLKFMRKCISQNSTIESKCTSGFNYKDSINDYHKLADIMSSESGFGDFEYPSLLESTHNICSCFEYKGILKLIKRFASMSDCKKIKDMSVVSVIDLLNKTGR